MKRMALVYLVTLLFASLGNQVWAQTFRGGISGTVADSSGAVIASAAVKATNDATGLSYSTLSSGAGEFSFQDPMRQQVRSTSKVQYRATPWWSS
jgi:hypothetical protein